MKKKEEWVEPDNEVSMEWFILFWLAIVVLMIELKMV